MQTYTFEQASELLGVKVSKIRQMARDHRLLTALNEEGKRAIVADCLIETESGWQAVDGLQGTFTILLDGGFSVEDATKWLLEENEFFPNPPLEMLRAGGMHRVNRVAGMLAF